MIAISDHNSPALLQIVVTPWSRTSVVITHWNIRICGGSCDIAVTLWSTSIVVTHWNIRICSGAVTLVAITLWI